jgi:hypothetical protein
VNFGPMAADNRPGITGDDRLGIYCNKLVGKPFNLLHDMAGGKLKHPIATGPQMRLGG